MIIETTEIIVILSRTRTYETSRDIKMVCFYARLGLIIKHCDLRKDNSVLLCDCTKLNTLFFNDQVHQRLKNGNLDNELLCKKKYRVIRRYVLGTLTSNCTCIPLLVCKIQRVLYHDIVVKILKKNGLDDALQRKCFIITASLHNLSFYYYNYGQLITPHLMSSLQDIYPITQMYNYIYKYS